MPELMWSPPSSQQSRRSPCSRTSQLSLAVVSFTVKSRSAPVLGVVGGDTSGPRGDKGAGDAGLGLTPRTRGLAGTDGLVSRQARLQTKGRGLRERIR